MKTLYITIYIILLVVCLTLLLDKFYKKGIDNPKNVIFYDNENVPIMRYYGVDVALEYKDRIVIRDEDNILFVILKSDDYTIEITDAK